MTRDEMAALVEVRDRLDIAFRLMNDYADGAFMDRHSRVLPQDILAEVYALLAPLYSMLHGMADEKRTTSFRGLFQARLEEGIETGIKERNDKLTKELEEKTKELDAKQEMFEAMLKGSRENEIKRAHEHAKALAMLQESFDLKKAKIEETLRAENEERFEREFKAYVEKTLGAPMTRRPRAFSA